MNPYATALTASTLLLYAGGAQAAASDSQAVDFSGFGHGEIVTGQLLPGVQLSVENPNAALDLAVIFDTTHPSDRDNDLVGPSWGGGNLAASQAVLGNALIIQEVDGEFDGYTDAHQTHVNTPDDEGRRPAGSVFFTFDFSVDTFGLDLIDVEGPEEYGDASGFIRVFSGQDAGVTVSFAEFMDPASGFYDPSVVFGDNHANRILPLTAQRLGLDGFDRVEVSLGGSGAIDNVTYTPIPEPTSAALLALAGLALVRRRR